MEALLMVLAIAPTMWLGQTILLLAAGLRPRLRISADGAPSFVRIGTRTVTQAAIVGVILLYPRVPGRSVADYYGLLMPLNHAHEAAFGVGVALLYLSLLYLAWNLTGAVYFSVRHPRRRVLRRLAVLPLTAIFGALVEELLFRGVLLNGTVFNGLPSEMGVAISTVVFAAAHYVRDVKRKWTFAGHLMLGACLSLAFVWSETLWLPIGLHAGGIAIIMGLRPFVRYRGPEWLTGASVFPYSGAVGVIALLMLTISLSWHYG